ncbi:MAG TPA: glycosyltransferase [Candidatus Dormibacteraeota bacterium]|nr:glycosyltransferase [Candidatus Dormibacteraeota bacterium]
MSRIRVLHVLAKLKGYGAERQVLNLLPLLPNAEIEVGVLAIYDSRLTDEERAQLGLPAFEVGRRSRNDYSFPLRLVREIKAFAPTIVHTHTHVGKYWGRAAARAAGVPIIVHTEHNPCDPRRNPLERLIDPFLNARTARVVTFLSEQRESLARYDGLPPEKVTIIPNGLFPPPPAGPEQRARAREMLGLSGEERAVLVIGRLEHQKNQRLAIEALAALPDALRVRMRLFFLGNGGQEATLRELVRGRALDDRVTFLGYRTDAAALLPGADLLLMTSLFEGMPLVLIEAMFAGVPILTTPWVGARSMIADGVHGYVAESWDPLILARALERALTGDVGRAAVAERARAHALAAYDIHRMAEAHRALYVELAGHLMAPTIAAAS